jgi:hypothetical protein
LRSNNYTYNGRSIIPPKSNIIFKLFDTHNIPAAAYNVSAAVNDTILPGPKSITLTTNSPYYTGEKTVAYNIVANINTQCSYSNYDDIYEYTGHEIKPTNISVTLNNSDYTLQNGHDYRIEYDPNINYITYGEKRIIIRGIEPYYTGTKYINY